MMLSTILSVSLAATPDATLPPHAGAEQVNDPAPIRLTHVPAQDAPVIASAASRVQLGMLEDRAPTPAFAAQGTWRFQVQGGGAVDVTRSRNKAGFGGIGASYFLIEGLSIDFELNGYFFSQRGHDTGGANLGLLFRWHFINEPTWSVYLDGGSGILWTRHRVPDNGTPFNFASQLGAGLSFEVNPDVRLMTGVRWQHISNASLGSNNPGRDHVLGYVMLSMPF